MTSQQRAEEVREEYRQLVMSGKSGKQSLTKLIKKAIDAAVKADRKEQIEKRRAKLKR